MTTRSALRWLPRSSLSISRTTTKVVGAATLVGGGSYAYYTYSSSESTAGLRRQVQFWSRVGPVVWDYYWRTASSSPRVRFLNWKQEMLEDKDVSSKDNDESTRLLWIETREQERKQQKRQLLQTLHDKHAPEIFQALLDLKGLYVKLGQVLSVTILPIPEQYRVLFRTLQSDVPGWQVFDSVIRPVLESELSSNQGRTLEDIFETIDPIPCGAASIGQAHRAKLKHGDQEEVIVKVQYPDAAWQVPADIQCVGDFMKLCVFFGVVDESAASMSFDEFARQFLTELDYEQERSNLQTVYESSLDPSSPYQRRNVIIPKVYTSLCSGKVITMSYLPGPKLEEEAKRQLALLGIDTSSRKGGMANIIRDAAKEAENPNDPEAGELARRVTSRMDAPASAARPNKERPLPLKLKLARLVGNTVGIDSVLWFVRWARQLLLWSQAAGVSAIQATPDPIVPTSWKDWATAHKSAARQAAQLSLTKEWVEALFDVHGHQIFNLGLFNADPHPGNILVIQDEREGGQPSNKLGLIDYGQCKRLSTKEQVQIAQLILSVVDKKEKNNDEKVATAFRDLGIETKNDSTEFLAEFARLMFGPLQPRHLDHGWHKKLHQQDRVTYFPKELSMVYRTSLLLRGLAVSLQLNFSVGDQWKQHAQEVVDRNPDLVQQISRERLYKSSGSTGTTEMAPTDSNPTTSVPLS